MLWSSLDLIFNGLKTLFLSPCVLLFRFVCSISCHFNKSFKLNSPFVFMVLCAGTIIRYLSLAPTYPTAWIVSTENGIINKYKNKICSRLWRKYQFDKTKKEVFICAMWTIQRESFKFNTLHSAVLLLSFVQSHTDGKVTKRKKSKDLIFKSKQARETC